MIDAESSSYADSSEAVKAFYDRQAAEHPDMTAILGVYSRLAADFRDSEEWHVFKRMLLLTSNMHVLELGCGGGRWCEHLAPIVGTVTGIDLSSVAIDHARHRSAKRHLRNITYLHCSIEEFQPVELYDLIYFSGVSLYLNEAALKKSLTRYRNFLKNTGHIVLRDSITNEAHSIHHTQGYRAEYRTLHDFIVLFDESGFSLVHSSAAFHELCLHPFLNNHRVSRYYEKLPPLLQHLLLQTLKQYASRSMMPDRHWRDCNYEYLHSFLVFRKKQDDVSC